VTRASASISAGFPDCSGWSRKNPIARGISFHVCALQGGHGFNKCIFKPVGCRGRSSAGPQLNREIFKPFVQLVKVRRFVREKLRT